MSLNRNSFVCRAMGTTHAELMITARERALTHVRQLFVSQQLGDLMAENDAQQGHRKPGDHIDCERRVDVCLVGILGLHDRHADALAGEKLDKGDVDHREGYGSESFGSDEPGDDRKDDEAQ